MKKSEIVINIEVDDNFIPEKINWSAPDGGIDNQNSKVAFLNFWDSETKELLKIDLWTKEFPIDDLKRFYHQLLISMADSYENATSESDIAEGFRIFAEDFATKTAIKM